MAHRPEIQTRGVRQLASGLGSAYVSSGAKVIYLHQREQALTRRHRQIVDLPVRPAAAEWQVQVQRSATRQADQSQVWAPTDIGQRTLTVCTQPGPTARGREPDDSFWQLSDTKSEPQYLRQSLCSRC
jgi:hypothetical protein